MKKIVTTLLAASCALTGAWAIAPTHATPSRAVLSTVSPDAQWMGVISVCAQASPSAHQTPSSQPSSLQYSWPTRAPARVLKHFARVHTTGIPGIGVWILP